MSGKKELVEACKAGDVETVHRLLSHGCEVNTSYGVTPLCAAALNGHTSVVEILLKAGAHVNKEGVSYQCLEYSSSPVIHGLSLNVYASADR